MQHHSTRSGYRSAKGQKLFNEPSSDTFDQWQYPLFVKPNRSGSSFGVSRIETPEEFSTAFKEAQKECTEVVVEEGISGVEVGCGYCVRTMTLLRIGNWMNQPPRVLRLPKSSQRRVPSLITRRNTMGSRKK